MKAAVLHEIGKPLRVEEVEEPVIGPDEVLVRTKACGICGTDIHIIDGWGYVPSLPHIPGHEPAGLVAAIGEGVNGLKVGDRVVPNIFFTCGSCHYCRTDRETLCTDLSGILGVLACNGAYAEYFKAPARQLFRLPDAIPFTEGGVIADAVVCAVHAVKERARVEPGDTIVVFGIGGVGSCVLQVSKAAGARVIAVDVLEQKLMRAEELGADEGLNAREVNTAGAVRNLTGGAGAECVIDCVGTQETMRQGVESLRRGGRLVTIGYAQERYPLDPRHITVNEIEILGSRSGGRKDTVEAIRLVAEGKVRSIVTETFPLEEVNKALELLRRGRALGRIALVINP